MIWLLIIMNEQEPERKGSLSPQKTSNFASVLSRILKLETKSKQTYSNLESIIDRTTRAIEQTELEIQGEQEVSEETINKLHVKMTQIKPLKNLKEQFNDLYKRVSGVSKTVETYNFDEEPLQIRDFFNEEQMRVIEQSLSDHYLAENNVEAAKAILPENEKLNLYQDCEMIKKSISEGRVEVAIEFLEKYRDEESNELNYELRKYAIVSLVARGEGNSALEYWKQSMPRFVDIRTREINMLLGFILAFSEEYWGNSQECENSIIDSRYKKFKEVDLDKLASQFVELYYRKNNLHLQNPISRCFQVGRKYRKTLIENLSHLPAGQPIPQNLPFTIDVEDSEKYHSQFFCPINKEVYGPDQQIVILKCGHMISQAALEKIKGGSRRKLICPICQKQHESESYSKVQF